MVEVTKLVNGGQGLGRLKDNQIIFVWNALPGERVKVRITKRKKNYVEGIAEEIIVTSSYRMQPRDEQFMSTSPWQILTDAAEAEAKLAIVRELMDKLELDIKSNNFHQSPKQWHYRNKMEYSFLGDETGLHLALHERDSSFKQIVQGSSLAMPAIDIAATELIEQLNNRRIRADNLKTVVIRANREGEVVLSLFIKAGDFSGLELTRSIKGIKVYYSNPKIPVSVPTKLIKTLGDPVLVDRIAGRNFRYDADSFFQVNLDIFEQVLSNIKRMLDGDDLVDIYAGVGVIGLSLAQGSVGVDLVEINPVAAKFALENAASSGLKARVIKATSIHALEHIQKNKTIIFDPPRAGLERIIIERLLEQCPEKIIYLSCNPATLARDIQLLKGKYKIKAMDIFNFFPQTPHIEVLAILLRK